MGKRNRERRREKQRRRARSGRGFDATVTKSVVLAAAEALHLQDETAYAEVVPMLVAGPPVPGGARSRRSTRAASAACPSTTGGGIGRGSAVSGALLTARGEK